jgi:hypothetical protein
MEAIWFLIFTVIVLMIGMVYSSLQTSIDGEVRSALRVFREDKCYYQNSAGGLDRNHRMVEQAHELAAMLWRHKWFIPISTFSVTVELSRNLKAAVYFNYRVFWIVPTSFLVVEIEPTSTRTWQNCVDLANTVSNATLDFVRMTVDRMSTMSKTETFKIKVVD